MNLSTLESNLCTVIHSSDTPVFQGEGCQTPNTSFSALTCILLSLYLSNSSKFPTSNVCLPLCVLVPTLFPSVTPTLNFLSLVCSDISSRLPDPCLSSSFWCKVGVRWENTCAGKEISHISDQLGNLTTFHITYFSLHLQMLSSWTRFIWRSTAVQHISWISICYMQVPHRRDPHWVSAVGHVSYVKISMNLIISIFVSLQFPSFTSSLT